MQTFGERIGVSYVLTASPTCSSIEIPKQTEKSKNKRLFFRRRGMPDAKKTKKGRKSGEK